MTAFQDTGVSSAVESVYGTYVAGTIGTEILADQLGQTLNKNTQQGQGFRVGSRLPRAARRVLINSDGTLTLPMEAVSKGMAPWWTACLGAGVSTLVSGSTYQHNFTIGDTPPSRSIQEQIVEAGLTVDDYSWSGCMVDSWEFAFPNVGIATLKMTLDAQKLSTAQSHVAPAYKTEPVNLFSFNTLSFAKGTFTAATTTALPSAATPMLNVRGGTVRMDRNLVKDRFNGGNGALKSQPVPGAPAVTGTLDLEYDSTTYRDLVINDGSLCLVVTMTGGALSTGLETITIPLPCIKFDGDLPTPNGSELIVTTMPFTCLDDLTNTAFGVYMRTADSTLL